MEPFISEDVLSEVDTPSSVLVIAFGGLAMKAAGLPPFEFFRMLSDQGSVKKVFLRDRYRCWYHRGVHGLAESLEGVGRGLRQTIDEAEATKVVMVGASAGGYAALLFGRLLGVTEVHAFGPQTFISSTLRRRHGDTRFEWAISPLLSSDSYREEYADLSPLFQRTSAHDTRFFIHFCESDALDAVHARHLKPEPGLLLRGYEGEQHNVAKHLLQTGGLQLLMREIVSPDPVVS